MRYAVANNARTRLTAPLYKNDTVIYVEDYNSFPIEVDGDPPILKPLLVSINDEIMKVIPGIATPHTFDIQERGCEGTIIADHAIGDTVENRFTAGTYMGIFEETKRTSTVIVAASNSSQKSKDGADCICTGAADQNPINNAINSLPSVGGKVLLMEGTYNISDSIVMKSNVTLEGMGSGSTVLKGVYANKSLSFIKSTSLIYGIRISNLFVDGTNLSNATYGHYGININCQRSIIEDVKITKVSDYPIYLQGNSYDNVVSKCYISNSYHGIELSGRDNIVKDSVFDNIRTGIAIFCNQRNVVIGNIIKNCYNTGRHGSGDIWSGNMLYNNSYTGADNTVLDHTHVMADITDLTAGLPTPDYNSGWFSVTRRTSYTQTHGLGSIPSIIMLQGSAVNNPTSTTPIFPLPLIIFNSSGSLACGAIFEVTFSDFYLKTADSYVMYNISTSTGLMSGYYRILAWR